MIATLKSRQREISVVLLLGMVVWARQMMVGEMTAEIERLASAQGVPARRKVLAKVQQAAKDAAEVKVRQDAIRQFPLPGANLATALERLHRDRGLPPSRSRLTPRSAQALDGGMQEESVELMITSMVLEEAIEYMQALETLGPAVRIRSMRLQKNGDTLTLTMTVAALKL